MRLNSARVRSLKTWGSTLLSAHPANAVGRVHFTQTTVRLLLANSPNSYHRQTMPLFPKKKGDKKQKGGLTEYEQQPESDQANSRDGYPKAPTAAQPQVPAPQPANGSQAPTPAGPALRKLVFYTQLAHGSSTERIEGFTNVRELYEEISKAFDIPVVDVLFCTLNTHKVDMDKLLGGQIGLEDLIVAHVRGNPKAVECMKSEAALGLTITDNGAGYAFIKRIKESSIMEGVAEVLVGDHIEAINGKSMVGARHFEVAKEFKDLPVGFGFTVNLVEPKKAFTKIAPRTAAPLAPSPLVTMATEDQVGTGRETLRLHSSGPAEIVQEEPDKFESVAINKCDDMLENFFGIRDETLAETLVGLFKGNSDFAGFLSSVLEELGDLESEDFVYDLWGMMGDVKAGRL